MDDVRRLLQIDQELPKPTNTANQSSPMSSANRRFASPKSAPISSIAQQRAQITVPYNDYYPIADETFTTRQAFVNPDAIVTSSHSQNGTMKYQVVWRVANPNRKHNPWKGDGVLVIGPNNNASLTDIDKNRVLTEGIVQDPSAIEAGDVVQVGTYECMSNS